MMEKIKTYFPNFEAWQYEKLQQAMELHQYWNSKINLISRKDITNLEVHHYLHSLSILLFQQIEKGSSVLDVGTGGGFPGIPLAIALPDVRFTLIDSIQKKIKVVTEIANELSINNLDALQIRAEAYKGIHTWVIARAVSQWDEFYSVSKKNAGQGIIYYKGGDLKAELQRVPKSHLSVFNIYEKLQEPFFETKKIVSLRQLY